MNQVYSEAEIASILDKYADLIYRMAYIQVKDHDLADDVFQEVCMRLLRLKKRLAGEEHVKAWLLKVTVHCCRDFWKSAWRRKVTLVQAQPEEAAAAQGAASEQEGYVTQCVHRLPEKYRVVIHLYYYEEYSIKEIAHILDIRENTAASQLARGRDRLKKMLEAGGNAYEVCGRGI
ncbi:MAG: sigma-70 family RNA polymerase sigma factor [Eubacterium sp.]|nr:sigma-70 family RNA polymerase sigma factor [Eubacterium sp.]